MLKMGNLLTLTAIPHTKIKESKLLPIINVFNTPYEKWTTRTPTLKESMDFYNQNGFFTTFVKDKLLYTINNHLDAAISLIKENGVNNSLENHIDHHLDNDPTFKTWRRSMPQKTPKILSNYQQRYPQYDVNELNLVMDKLQNTIQDNQYLFHGGLWNTSYKSIYTTRVLSTSFCPQIALRNAEHSLKAFNNNRIDLFILKTVNSKTNCFAFRKNGTNKGHEKEVLFAKNAKLVLTNQFIVRHDYTVYNAYNAKKKHSCIY